MKYMTGNEIRNAFKDFFESKNHMILKSFSLVPDNDPSLLLIGAGMAPMKKYFTGEVEPISRRIATSQKCIRTGDIENVGRTARHHTFFEMLGNFSFGDYFKEEAITWAWEFLTDVMDLDKNKLYVTVHPDDTEAYDIWKKYIAEDRIFKLEDNFWEIGDGPCGPDTEIFYDLGAERSCRSASCGVGCDCDRYLEIWNLVFTQFNKVGDQYVPLKNKNVDTGIGLERLASVIQQKESNFETDLLYPIIEKIISISGANYNDIKQKTAVKVIADHIRAVTMMISDGIEPSNKDRGYVLRRIIRRSVRFGHVLNIERTFLSNLVDVVIDIYRHPYPELIDRAAGIKSVIEKEEKRFRANLKAGMKLLNGIIDESESVIAGMNVFKLYDTYGFPPELTEEIARERNLEIDYPGFDECMRQQKERARNARIAP